jgi:transketolase
MRYLFADTLLKIAKKDKKIVLMTGDLGFNLFEELQKKLGNRFINAGVAEHNMVTAAAGMAYAGFKPWIYSIAPFVTIKVLEEIKNDVVIPHFNVKVIGLGGGYDYAIAGPTHHSLGDVGSLLTIPGMKVYTPGFSEDVSFIVRKMHQEKSPSYLRLTKAKKSEVKVSKYLPFRRILAGNKITVVALGSIINEVIGAILKLKTKNSIDLWLVSELPCEIPKNFLISLSKIKKIILIEEHFRTGGMGQYLSSILLEKNIKVDKFFHHYSKGYISKRYGSRDFYLKETGLDKDSIARTLNKLLRS